MNRARPMAALLKKTQEIMRNRDAQCNTGEWL